MHWKLMIALPLVVAACAMDPNAAGDDPVGTVEEALSAPCGGFWIQGQIEIKYNQLGGRNAAFLGCPTNNETSTPPPRNQGRFNEFTGGGSIYWTSNLGAHEVHGLIKQKWKAKGWEQGVLGFPITDESAAWHGRFNHFEGGSIYWDQGFSQAYEVHGIIAGKWYGSGWERGPMGFPWSDEIPTPNKWGAFNRFEFGSIYWQGGKPQAFMVRADMRDHCWGLLGWENSWLGFPIEDTKVLSLVDDFAQSQRFEHGSLYYDFVTGACVPGP